MLYDNVNRCISKSIEQKNCVKYLWNRSDACSKLTHNPLCFVCSQLEKNPPSLTDAYWFEREDVHSDHYHLQTVVTPKRCLRLKKGEKRVVLNETGDSIEIQHTSNMNKQVCVPHSPKSSSCFALSSHYTSRLLLQRLERFPSTLSPHIFIFAVSPPPPDPAWSPWWNPASIYTVNLTPSSPFCLFARHLASAPLPPDPRDSRSPGWGGNPPQTVESFKQKNKEMTRSKKRHVALPCYVSSLPATLAKAESIRFLLIHVESSGAEALRRSNVVDEHFIVSIFILTVWLQMHLLINICT